MLAFPICMMLGLLSSGWMDSALLVAIVTGFFAILVEAMKAWIESRRRDED